MLHNQAIIWGNGAQRYLLTLSPCDSVIQTKNTLLTANNVTVTYIFRTVGVSILTLRPRPYFCDAVQISEPSKLSSTDSPSIVSNAEPVNPVMLKSFTYIAANVVMLLSIHHSMIITATTPLVRPIATRSLYIKTGDG